MRKDIECPYCEAEQDIDHDDGSYGYGEDEIYVQRCNGCNKKFIYTASIAFYYDAKKAPCQNGGKHNWYIGARYPKGLYSGYKRCTYCDIEERVDKDTRYDEGKCEWVKKTKEDVQSGKT